MDWCTALIPRTQCHPNLRSAVRQRVVVSQHMIIASCLALITSSYHLMLVGSLLQSVSLFTLSLAKPGQFYLVNSTGSFIDESFKCVLGSHLSRCPRWDWDGPDICSQYSINISTLLKKSYICNVPRGLRDTIWCHYTSNHAQPLSERARRVFQGRPHQCGLRQCSIIGSLLIYAHESTAETVRQLSCSGTDMFS